jgi:AraC-like DNA-binding protein
LNNQKNYYFDPVDKEILCCHHTTEGDYITQKQYYHRHDAYEIYLYIRGNTNLLLEQACYHLESGDLIVISPSEMHRTVCQDEQVYERAFVNIKKSVLDRLSTKQTNLFSCFDSHPLGQKNLTHLSDKHMKHFIDLTDKLHQALEASDYGQDVLAVSYLSQILVFTNTMYQNSVYPATNIMPELVRDTMNYIEDHINDEITLEQLSNKFYLSGTYISRQFKKHTGITIRNYILEQRIVLAKTLLNEGKNVSEACYMSGFCDYSNFIRSFTKLVGISPGHFKK